MCSCQTLNIASKPVGKAHKNFILNQLCHLDFYIRLQLGELISTILCDSHYRITTIVFTWFFIIPWSLACLLSTGSSLVGVSTHSSHSSLLSTKGFKSTRKYRCGSDELQHKIKFNSFCQSKFLKKKQQIE